ncbi:hypothetical protein [Brevibacterium limosum]|uniref:hypothetical protein n=1 Tax=Brevibacterium limosum TaxID=2697565 RepID=UPI0014236946|nr:hypothetical protein [Brevibacterium limosum]
MTELTAPVPSLLLLIGIAFTAVVVIGVVVTAFVLRYAPPGPVTDRLSEQALTPEEIITEVAPHKDGTKQIRQRLFFETPPDDGGPVGRRASTIRLRVSGSARRILQARP